MKNQEKNGVPEKEKLKLDFTGSVYIFAAAFFIFILAFRKIKGYDVNSDTMVCIAISSYLFTFSDLFLSFNQHSKVTLPMKLVALLVILYGLIIPSGYLPTLNIEYSEKVTDGLSLFAIGGIVLSIAIKQLTKKK